MPATPVSANTVNLDSQQFFIITPVSATIASQTVIDSTLNVKVYSLLVNNITGTAATLSITDGNGNKFITSASFAANSAQVIPFASDGSPGFYMKNGLKLTSDTDDALVVWFAVQRA